MTTAAPALQRNRIYQDVCEKRDEDCPASGDAVLERGWLKRDKLVFASDVSRDRALSDGIFLLRIPGEIDLAPADAFARQFHLGPAVEPYGHFRDYDAAHFADPLLGFHQRINQIEQFLLERRFWDDTYPTEIAIIGHRLTEIGRIVLRSVLAEVRIPAEAWRQVTGGCSESAGSYHLTFNHYRPAVDSCRLRSHKDDGFLTILRATTPGLEINRDEVWERVGTDEAHFVINFGLSMELLTKHAARAVAAIMHRVRRQAGDRSSFGHFTSSRCVDGGDEGIHRWRDGVGLQRICSSRELIDNNDHEIYAGTEPRP